MIAVPKSQHSSLGCLSSQANNSMGFARVIFARAVSNPGPQDYSFDDIAASLQLAYPETRA